MRIKNLKIENYKSLKDIEFDLDKLSCIVGENNAGKSSLLQAILTICSSRNPARKEFYDETKPIRITATFSDVSEIDLQRVSDAAHRERISGLITEDRTFTIVKQSVLEDGKVRGKSGYLIPTLQPNEERYQKAWIAENIKGKSGAALTDWHHKSYPELKDRLTGVSTQAAVKEIIMQFVEHDIPDGEKTLTDQAPPTGFDNALRPFLPEPIYVPAVKDLEDDFSTASTSSFGKLIAILLESVQQHFQDIDEKLLELRKRLSRVLQNGEEIDERIDEVKSVENMLEGFIQESFPGTNIKLNVPTPELKTILSGSEILLNDGHESTLAEKGDGIKRTVTFALLRAYNELSKMEAGEEEEEAEPAGAYVLLYEEPELYLHPRAQLQLFDALGTFSADNQVITTTHSGLFLAPNVTKAFIKMYKVKTDDGTPPLAQKYVADLTQMPVKDQFQLICHENNASAFFASKVVLVEGDSDHLILRHYSRMLNPDWNDRTKAIAYARVGGKGSFLRYRRFFENFGVQVALIGDLDCVVSGLEKLTNDQAILEKKAELIGLLNTKYLEPAEDGPAAKRLKKVHGSGEMRRLITEAQQKLGEEDAAGCIELLEEFFTQTNADPLLELLKSPPAEDVRSLLNEVLTLLGESHIYILPAGCIEDYFLADIGGERKVENAVHFANDCTTLEAAQAELKPEHLDSLAAICSSIHS